MAAQREWFEKDYYRVLGVSDSATAKEIKSAYRKLSRQYHPDTNSGDAAAEERFKEISAAYDVVGDAERRKEYDEVRRLGPAAAGFPGGGGRGRVPVPGRRRPRRPARRAVQPPGPGPGRPRPAGGSAPGPGPRDRAAPHLRRRRGRRHHRRAPHERRALQHLPRLGGQAGHGAPRVCQLRQAAGWCPTTRASSRSRRPAPCAAAAASTVDDPCPTCQGSGIGATAP